MQRAARGDLGNRVVAQAEDLPQDEVVVLAVSAHPAGVGGRAREALAGALHRNRSEHGRVHLREVIDCLELGVVIASQAVEHGVGGDPRELQQLLQIGVALVGGPGGNGGPKASSYGARASGVAKRQAALDGEADAFRHIVLLNTQVRQEMSVRIEQLPLFRQVLEHLLDEEGQAVRLTEQQLNQADRRLLGTESSQHPLHALELKRAQADALGGSLATQVLDYLSESGATLVEYELAEDVFSAVLRGEADATLVDIGFAHEYMTKSGEGLAIVGPQVMLDAGTGIGVRETDGALKDKLDRAIDAMKQDGSLNALIEKWFGLDAETF